MPEIESKPMPTPIKALILDMDGVIWRDEAPIGDLPKIFATLRQRGLKFIFATNNSTKTPEQYIEKLSTLGVNVEPWQVITSAIAAAQLLKRDFPSGGHIFVIGEEGVKSALREQGFEISTIDNAEKSDAVIFGLDRHVNFAKMREATLLVRRGVPFYATNPDKTFPTPRGEIPGSGAWVSVIVTAAGGVEPIYAGKPFPFMMELCLQKLGTTPAETLVVGDRFETDILAGQAVGCPTALVLSGVSVESDSETWRPPPARVEADLSAVINQIGNSLPYKYE